VPRDSRQPDRRCFAIFETEVLVCGDATIGTLTDHDDYLKVLGKLTVGRQTSYDDPD
jgi:hypothetical protein